MTARVAVVIPSYRQAAFIGRTLDSVLAQSPPPAEVVVCDGGSDDGTVDILRRYGDRIRWTSGPDGGQAAAVSAGIAATHGDVIAWINSDDVYYPGAFAAVQSAFAADPTCDVVYGNADHIDAEDRVVEPYPVEAWSFARLTETCFLCQPAVFVRRRAVERFGPPDAALRYCMDYEWWLRMGAAIPFRRIAARLAGSRLHAATKTLGERVAVHREICTMLRRRLGTVPRSWIAAWAHAVVEARLGADRSTPERERRFVRHLLRATGAALLRWRVWPDAALRRELRRWWKAAYWSA